MKFSTKEDMEVPIEDAFAMLSDADGFELAAMRRGAEVSRMDPSTGFGAGSVWQVNANVRGKRRDITATLAEYDRPNQMRFEAVSSGMNAQFLIELVALSRTRTRMRVELDIKPKTLSARLLLQSAKLAKNTLTRRYKTRIAHFASDTEERFKAGKRT